MTIDELSNHDCHKGEEDSCDCDNIKVTDGWDKDGGDDYGYDNFAQEERGNN